MDESGSLAIESKPQEGKVGTSEAERPAQVVAESPPHLREDQIQNALSFLNHPKASHMLYRVLESTNSFKEVVCAW